MPSHAAARRRAPAHSRTRHATPPRFDRRVSGPTHAVALPAGRAGSGHGTTGLFERLRALPDSRVVDRVLRGRACIWIIGVLLGGIVAMQVSLLKLNSSISTSIEQAGTLERVNADLEMEVAQLSSSDRIEAAALKEGMVSPSAGDVGFLRSRPGDVRLALRRMTGPSAEARDVMANGGRSATAVVGATATVAPALATPAPTTAAPTATATPAPVVTQAPPAATAAPAVTQAPPAATAAPVATTAPATTAAPTG